MTSRRRMQCCSVLAIASLAGNVNAGDDAQFQPLGALAEPPFGGARSIARDVSADGMVVVGQTRVKVDGAIEIQAFRWTKATGMVALGSLPGGMNRSIAAGVSPDGSTIVGRADAAGFLDEAFVWQSRSGMVGMGGFEPPSAGKDNFSSAEAASHDGSTIVGAARSLTFGGPPGLDMEAFVTDDGRLLGLGKLDGGLTLSWAYDVSDDGQVVVGFSGSTPGEQAFRWTQSEGMVGLGDLPGGPFSSEAFAISGDGKTIVGRSRSEASGEDESEAFRWTEDQGMVALGALPGGSVFSSRAYDVSADGSVIVGTSTSARAPVLGEGFLWSHDTGMHSLHDLLEQQGATGFEQWLLWPRAVSADGRTIVGVGMTPDGEEEAWRVQLAYVPVFGDLTGDGAVNVGDLLTLLGQWGQCGETPCTGDLDGDGNVDVSDLLLLLGAWG